MDNGEEIKLKDYYCKLYFLLKKVKSLL